jgi:hypothetical protein
MTLCLLFTGRFNDIGGPIQAARWLASERKTQIRQLKTAKKGKKKKKLEQAVVKEALATQPQPQPFPSQLPDIEALIDAYDLLSKRIEAFDAEAKQAAGLEQQRLIAARRALYDEEEETLLALMLSLC